VQQAFKFEMQRKKLLFKFVGLLTEIRIGRLFAYLKYKNRFIWVVFFDLNKILKIIYFAGKM
jgi:hypothetical protein